ncbi:UDP-glucose 4-epimerase GalE [Salinimicrobium terrae]|uniref:UDP-glucose 4-epimerase GalE n=1 Tax=Salinimicrobium terrae TaxID=470866 RepID=UPI000407711E|nr:UDP-glucose 4-epimerase GalE [Salinimicrobium terrae]
MKRILVTGGAGFIGSHTVVELLNSNYEVVIADDLSNSSMEVLNGIEHITGQYPIFEKIDLKCKNSVSELFNKYTNIESVIHFAAHKAVGESVQNPLKYYENNLSPLVYILQELHSLQRPIHFIFSSSCTVYGDTSISPITEDAEVKSAASPYGNTKQIGEEILKDTCKSNNFLNVISLRYFNPIGAHPSNNIGELPQGKPQNLVPFITQTAAGLHNSLTVHGDDYPTPDGTCIRDYIDVVDLAKAHVLALKRLINGENKENYEVFNLGTGKGSSVKEVIQSFEKMSAMSLTYKVGPRRYGDVVTAFANTSKAEKILGWKSKTSLDKSILKAWNWEKKIRNIKNK